MESTALEISGWLWASCPANLRHYYVLDSRHNLQEDKQTEAALFAAQAEVLSEEKSLAKRQTVFWLHDGNQTLKAQSGLGMTASTEEALGTLAKTGTKSK